MITSRYDLEGVIRKGERATIFRGRRRADGQAVVVKRLNDPSPAETGRLEQEAELARRLAGAGAPTIMELTRFDGAAALVMVDSAGEALADRLSGGALGLEDALSITREVAATLDRLHGVGFVHRDINCRHILWNPVTGQVELVDFASCRSLGTAGTGPESGPESGGEIGGFGGTLAYVAPELTGRMSRGVDWRADLYSLGVCFYRMLTGRLPFEEADPLEVIHAHLARPPRQPVELAPALPKQVSDIAMRLLAKDPDDRYQSAAGLVADLDACLDALRGGRPVPVFQPGRRDRSARFRLPDRLYGRDEAMDRLGRAFAHAAVGGARLLLLSGAPGTGKSALVGQLEKALASVRAGFAEGKFDQVKRGLPYSGLAQAFGGLARRLMASPEEDLAILRAALARAVQGTGAVITDLVPEMMLLLGPQPPVEPLPPAESEFRFQLTMQNLVAALAQPDRPLVLSLEDLHWADRPSLVLLAKLLADPEMHHLLVIGSCRPDEVGAGHPLHALVEGAPEVDRIDLAELGEADVRAMVADALRRDGSEVDELARVCLRKTGGNPLFLGQFLLSLAEDGLVSVDPVTGGWQWETAAISRRASTANVVELMVAKIRKLLPEASSILSLAACLGASFSLPSLAAAAGLSAARAEAALQPAVEEGLVLRAGTGFRFLHDRVQQAAYSLIPEAERGAVRQKLGRQMLAALADPHQAEQLFDIVEHLGQGSPEPAAGDALSLAGLFLAAARRAKRSAAFEAALGYAEAGLCWMGGGQAWSRDHDLALALHGEAAEAAFMTGDLERMTRHCQTVLARVRTVEEAIPIQYLRVTSGVSLADPHQAIELGLAALRDLGIRIPSRPNKARLLVELLRGQRAIARHDRFLAGGGWAAPAKGAAAEADTDTPTLVKLIVAVGGAAYTARPDLLAPIVVRALERVRPDLDSRQSALVFGLWAIICGVVGKRQSALAAGTKALTVLERCDRGPGAARPLFLALFGGRHFGAPVTDLRDGFHEAYRLCLEAGDSEYATYSLVNGLLCGWFSGLNLPLAMRPEAADAARKLDRIRNSFYRDFLGAFRQVVDGLVDGAERPMALDGAHLEDEAASLARLQERQHSFPLALMLLLKLQLAVHMGDASDAQAAQAAIAPYLGSVAAIRGSSGYPVFLFNQALAAALAAPASGSERRRAAGIVNRARRHLARMAVEGSADQRHRARLLEAEWLNLLNRAEAGAAYEAAIAAAAKMGYAQDEGLAAERAARHHEAWGNAAAALGCWLKARDAYRRWGAGAKLRRLDLDRPRLAALAAPQSGAASQGAPLDYVAVLRAAQTISGEIRAEALYETLLRTCLVTAGATRGVLALMRDGRLVLAAENGAGAEGFRLLPDLPLEGGSEGGEPLLPVTVATFAARTREPVVLNHAADRARFPADLYLHRKQPRSLLCLPLLRQGQMVGLLYLENGLAAEAFAPGRFEAASLLASQIAVSLENARLYDEVAKVSRTLEQQVAERTGELREKSELLESTLACMRDGIAVFDGDQRLRMCNQRAKQIFGLPDEMHKAGRLYAEIVQALMDSGMLAADQRPQFAEGVDELDMADGRVIQIRRNPMPDGGMVRMYVDVTADRLRERQMQAAQQQLVKAEKLASLGQLVAGVAHEINTPIGVALTAATTLSDRTGGFVAKVRDGQVTKGEAMRYAELAEESARLVVANIDRAARLIHSFKEVAVDQTTAERRRFALAPYVEDVLTSLAPSLRKGGHAASVECEPGLEVDGYPGALAQVLTNLVMNSVVHGYPDGRAGRIAITARQDGEMVELVYADDGAGIAEAHLSRVFDPFFTTRRGAGGTGLGLHIVHNIVTGTLGGGIAVERGVPSGARFRIRFPQGGATGWQA